MPARTQVTSRRIVRRGGRPTIGRLIKYEITDLFGIFDYMFDLDSAGLTLLTGVNGTGKSTILKTIDAVSTGNWVSLLEVPFTCPFTGSLRLMPLSAA